MPKYTKREEIFNMVSHIVGGAFGIAALVICVVFSALKGDGYLVVASSIYGATMIILYTMSSIYHGLKPELKAKGIFRVIDHCSIYLLIAGTYTPITLCALREYNTALGWSFFGIIWGIAILGIVLTAISLEKFKVFSAICYLAMGWCVIFLWKPTVAALTNNGILLILLGGISYTIGAIFYYCLKKKEFSHGIFHIFVLLGSILHMLAILFYIIL